MWEPIANDLYGPLGHVGRLDTSLESAISVFACDLRPATCDFIEVGIGRSVANSVP